MKDEATLTEGALSLRAEDAGPVALMNVRAVRWVPVD